MRNHVIHVPKVLSGEAPFLKRTDARRAGGASVRAQKPAMVTSKRRRSRRRPRRSGCRVMEERGFARHLSRALCLRRYSQAGAALVPLVDDDAEIVEGFHGGFHSAADLRTASGGDLVGLFDGGYAAVGPRIVRGSRCSASPSLSSETFRVLRGARLSGRIMPPMP